MRKAKSQNGWPNCTKIEFEFQRGIRDIFLDRLGGEEFCIGVIGSLTEKIASHFPFPACLSFLHFPMFCLQSFPIFSIEQLLAGIHSKILIFL